MRRLVPIAMTLSLILLVLAACSDNAVSPEKSDPADKRGRQIYDPPPGMNPFMSTLAGKFDQQNWVEIKVDLPAKMGGTVSVVPDGYPATHPIKISIAANPNADKMLVESTIWVAVPDPGLEFISIPGDCIIFRTQNIPPNGTPTATIEMPVMPWYRTGEYNGDFASYDLHLNDYGFPAPFELQTVSIPWPPVDPDVAIYVETEAKPDKDEPNGILDRVLDPDVPGDDDED